MADPFVGEIKMFGGNFAIQNYAFCNGALMAIADNDVLYSLIGTTYGGDGQTTFGLPDLRGRIPVHQSSNFPMGQSAGTESVTLTQQQLPAHNHPVIANSNGGTSGNPQNNIVAGSTTTQPYSQGAISNQLGNQSITPTGGSQPHDNMMPYLCINFIISLYGIYPSQS